jgi:excisionase family DNA binding protein
MTRPNPALLQVGFGLDELRTAITAGRLFLTVGEFSELYRCDERTARRGIERGDVPAVRVGSTVRIPVATLLRMAGLEPKDAAATPSTEIELANSGAASATDTATRPDLRRLKAIRHGHFDPPGA